MKRKNTEDDRRMRLIELTAKDARSSPTLFQDEAIATEKAAASS